MAAEPFYETGITIMTTMLASYIRIDDIVINLRCGENGFRLDFLHINKFKYRKKSDPVYLTVKINPGPG
jgi:hypothetical protein